MTTESKELVTQTINEIAISPDFTPEQFAGDYDAKDVVIPRISLMQGLSEAVADGHANMGDIVNSVNYEKLGGKDSPVDIIPLKLFKTVTESVQRDGSWEYVKTYQWDALSANLPLEDKDPEGNAIKRDRCLNVYCLVAKELEAGTAFPYLLTFRRTSFMAGRKLSTHLSKAAFMKQYPWSHVLGLTCNLVKGDKGNYYVYDVVVKRRSTMPEQLAGAEWARMVVGTSVTVAPEAGAEKTPATDIPADNAY